MGEYSPTGAASSCLGSCDCGFTAIHLTSAGVSSSFPPSQPSLDGKKASVPYENQRQGLYSLGYVGFLCRDHFNPGGPFLLLDLPGTPLCTPRFHFCDSTALSFLQ